MNNAHTAYDNVAKTIEQGNITDAVVLEKAAWMLEELKSDVESDLWESVLKHNQLIWSVIQAEMVDSAEHLPDQIKANIVSLAIYVDKRTNECLYNPERLASNLDVLINMNRNIALGLRGDPGNAIAA